MRRTTDRTLLPPRRPRRSRRVVSECRAPDAAILATALLLAGCRAGPDYARPPLDAQTAPDWRATDDDAIARADPGPIDAWWRAFDDPQLEHLLARLADGNLELAAARARVVEARARRGLADAEHALTIDVDAEIARLDSGDDALVLNGARPGSDTNLFSVGPLVGWEIDLWGRIGRLVEAADADLAAAAYDDRAVFTALAAELATSYFDALALARRTAALDDLLAVRSEAVALARARHDAGIGTASEVADADRALAETRARRPDLVRARLEAENAIAVLTGERPRDDLLDLDAAPALPPVIGIGQPAALLERRPDLRAAERRHAADVARIGAADAERHPRLALRGSFTLQADDAGGLLDDALVQRFGPTLSWPILDGDRIDANVRVREARAAQSRLDFERLVLRACAEVDSAAHAVIESRRHAAHLDEARRAADRAQTLAAQRLDAGLRDRRELLAARADAIALREQHAIAQQQALADSVRLYRALGGGWHVPGDDAATSDAAAASAAAPAQEDDR